MQRIMLINRNNMELMSQHQLSTAVEAKVRVIIIEHHRMPRIEVTRLSSRKRLHRHCRVEVTLDIAVVVIMPITSNHRIQWSKVQAWLTPICFRIIHTLLVSHHLHLQQLLSTLLHRQQPQVTPWEVHKEEHLKLLSRQMPLHRAWAMGEVLGKDVVARRRYQLHKHNTQSSDYSSTWGVEILHCRPTKVNNMHNTNLKIHCA